MGSKNNPGVFDCYANAEPDEPMFILLGRDPVAAMCVRLWCEIRKELGETPPEQIDEAFDCAVKMQEWAESKGKDIRAPNEALKRVFERLRLWDG